MNNKFYERCINIVSNLKLSYEEGIAREVILNELDILEKQVEDYQTRFDKAIEYIKKDEFVDYIPNSKSYLRLMKIRCDLLEILGDKENE